MPIDAIDLDFSGNIVPLPVRDKDPSVKIEFRFMRGIKSEVERIIKERIFNFRTASDFYRRAVWNQLLLLKEMNPEMKKRMSWQELWIETIEQSKKQREHGDMVAYMDREVDALKRAGAHSDARKLVYKEMNLIADSGPSDVWKRKMMKHIRRKHTDLLAQGLPSGTEEQGFSATT